MQADIPAPAVADTDPLASDFRFELPAGKSIAMDTRSGVSLHLHRSSWELEAGAWEYVFTLRRDGFEPALIGCAAREVEIGTGMSRQDLRADDPATVRSLASLAGHFALELPEYSVYLGVARGLVLPFSTRIDLRRQVCYRVLASTAWLCAQGPDPRLVYASSTDGQVVVAELPLM